MRILLAGGGSGGHLIPGIALYEEFKKRGVECKYVLRELDLRYTVAERIAVDERMLIKISGISRKLSIKTPIYLLKLGGVFFKIFRKIKKWKPDVIVTTGGYVSNPVALAALRLRKPLFIAEQNSVAGATNRFYSRFAKAVFTSFPDTQKLYCKKQILMGNPSIFNDTIDRAEALKIFELDDYENIIGISGGSQGAQKINDAVLTIFDDLKKRNIGVVWSVGAVDFDRLHNNGTIDRIIADYPNIKPFRFIKRMDAFFSCADIAISRGSATTIAELIHFGVPSIFIPITNSPDNHQYINSAYIANSEAGEILEEKDITIDSLLANIDKLLNSLDRYKMNLDMLKNDNPAGHIVDAVMEYLK